MTGFCAAGVGVTRLRLSCARPPWPGANGFILRGWRGRAGLSCAPGHVGESPCWRELGLAEAGKGREWCMVQHMLPPALPSRAEHGVLQLSPVLLGFPGQELLQA